MIDSSVIEGHQPDFKDHVEGLAYAHGGFIGKGILRQQPEDFQVTENLSFEPSREGEHEFVQLKKTGLNTDDVARAIARFCDVPRKAVSYAGMKDRQAVTSQWFSVHLPGQKGPDWGGFPLTQVNIEQATRHNKKLKTGAIKFNSFVITINQLTIDENLLNNRIEAIKEQGVPNYFMQQRFGFQANNLSLAHRVFSHRQTIKDRHKKGLLLSSVRSYLFNLILSQRVLNKNWDRAQQGDVFILDGTRNYFEENELSTELMARIKTHDIHPSGPLFGKGELVTQGEVKALEIEQLDNNKVFCEGLVRQKVDMSRRSLRVVPQNFKLEYLSDQKISLSFNLPSGSYATAVIRELINATT